MQYYNGVADFARARLASEKTIELEPKFAPWRLLLAGLYINEENTDMATQVLSDTLALAPDYVYAYTQRSYVNSILKNFTAAQADVEQAIKLGPNLPEPYMASGALLEKQQKFDDALTQYRKAVELDDTSYFARFSLGGLYLQKEDCEQASRQYEPLVADYPNIASGLVGMGWVKLCNKDATKALEYFRKAAKLDPYNADAQSGMGLAYTQQQRYEEAASAYSKALSLVPMGSGIHTLMATSQNTIQHLKSEYEVALRINPQSTSAHIGLSSILMQEYQLAEAEEQAREALKEEPNNLQAKGALGSVLAVLGKDAEAEKLLQEVLEKKPEDVMGHLYMGMVNYDKRSYSAAKKEFETYKKLKPSTATQQASSSSSDSSDDSADSSGSSSTTSSSDTIDTLITNIDTGYTMDEETAVSTVKTILDKYLSNGVKVRVEDHDGKGRTMMVDVTSNLQQSQHELAVDLAASVAAAFVPRIDPPVPGGVVVTLIQGSKPVATAEASWEVVRRVVLGLDTVQQFFYRLKFQRGTAAQPLASVTQLEADVAKLRELKATSKVPYLMITKDEMADHWSASVDDESKKAMLIDQQMLVLLGVLDPRIDLARLETNMLSDQVAGFYTPKEKKFYVLKDGEQDAYDQMTIAHEYVHALQDQNYDLTKLSSACSNDDERQALTALIEGDATLSMVFYAKDYVPTVDLMQASSTAAGVSAGMTYSVPLYLSESSMFPYESGLSFVYKVYQGGVWKAVNKMFDSPPKSTEQILHPEAYLEHQAPVKVSMPDVPAALKSDWRVVKDNVMGELDWQLAYAQQMGQGAASVAAKGWGGDHYVLLQKGSSDTYVLVTRTYWDSQDDADEFFTYTQVWMRHRSDFNEDVTDLVGPADVREYSSPTSAAYLKQNERYVTLVLGTDKESVQQVAAVVGK